MSLALQTDEGGEAGTSVDMRRMQRRGFSKY